MNKTILMLLTSIVGTSQNSVYKTSSTSYLYYGKWTCIAKAILTNQYQSSNTILLITGGDSSSDVISSKLFFRLKQLAAFQGKPHVQLELIQKNNSKLTESDVVSVTTVLGTSSIVGLYRRVVNSGERFAFTPVMINNTAPVFLSDQGCISSLPLGTQVACKKVVILKKLLREYQIGKLMILRQKKPRISIV